jgi:spectrin beta
MCYSRSWDKVYVVLRGNQILFYKDQKSVKSTPDVYFKGEIPLDMRGGTCEVASDYTKKKHVFRIK